MPLQLDYVTPQTGATASYHVIEPVILSKTGPATTATVVSYLSKDAYSAGKFGMYTQQIRIDGLPPENADPFAWAEQQLAANPAGATATTANRYAFAGAQVVD